MDEPTHLPGDASVEDVTACLRGDGCAVNITYAVGWVRQEENQYLSTPVEVARTLDDDLLRLMGYQQGAFALGYVGDVEDPLVALRRTELAPGEPPSPTT